MAESNIFPQQLRFFKCLNTRIPTKTENLHGVKIFFNQYSEINKNTSDKHKPNEGLGDSLLEHHFDTLLTVESNFKIVFHRFQWIFTRTPSISFGDF